MSPLSEIPGLMRRVVLAASLFSPALLMAVEVEFSSQAADREALERVYHAHRTGTKLPFEQAMPAAMIEHLVRLELHKEAVLRTTYAVTITPAMLATEVERIDTTTRAPEILTEIKHALGDDPARFARTMARPILVERELHARFENDDALHAAQRRMAEQAREQWLAKKAVDGAREIKWLLAPRPVEAKAETATSHEPVKGSAQSANYSVEATTQVAQPLSPPAAGEAEREKIYFEDLDPQLQNVLRAQLRQAGDVSAVIEMPSVFVIFQVSEKTDAVLAVSAFSVPKRSYEEWLAQQPE